MSNIPTLEDINDGIAKVLELSAAPFNNQGSNADKGGDMSWYSLGLAILLPLLFMLLSIRKKQNCNHDWFNMRVTDHRIKNSWVTNDSTIHTEIEVFETGESARLCEKCYKLERHLENIKTTEAMPRNGE